MACYSKETINIAVRILLTSNMNGPYRLIHLSAKGLALLERIRVRECGIVWVGVTELEEVYHWWCALKFQKPKLHPESFSSFYLAVQI